jgi:hypothetical protein
MYIRIVNHMQKILLETLIVIQLVKEIPQILWNPKLHFHIHKSPTQIPVLSKVNPVHTLPYQCFN